MKKSYSALQRQLFKLLSNAKIKEVVTILNEFALDHESSTDEEYIHDLIMISGRFYDFARRDIQGIIDENQRSVEVAKINSLLLQMIDKMPVIYQLSLVENMETKSGEIESGDENNVTINVTSKEGLIIKKLLETGFNVEEVEKIIDNRLNEVNLDRRTESIKYEDLGMQLGLSGDFKKKEIFVMNLRREHEIVEKKLDLLMLKHENIIKQLISISNKQLEQIKYEYSQIQTFSSDLLSEIRKVLTEYNELFLEKDNLSKIMTELLEFEIEQNKIRVLKTSTSISNLEENIISLIERVWHEMTNNFANLNHERGNKILSDISLIEKGFTYGVGVRSLLSSKDSDNNEDSNTQ